MANLAYLSRFWRPGRGGALYQGLQAAAAGCSVSCFLALLLSLAFPGPFRLAIYTIALNILITPVSATAGFLAGLKKSSASPIASENFAAVLAEVAGPQESACEVP